MWGKLSNSLEKANYPDSKSGFFYFFIFFSQIKFSAGHHQRRMPSFAEAEDPDYSVVSHKRDADDGITPS